MAVEYGNAWLVSTQGLRAALSQVETEVYYAAALQTLDWLEQILDPDGWHLIRCGAESRWLGAGRFLLQAELCTVVAGMPTQMSLLFTCESVRLHLFDISDVSTAQLVEVGWLSAEGLRFDQQLKLQTDEELA